MKRFLLLVILCAVASLADAAPWPSQCIQPITVGQPLSGRLATTDCSLNLGGDIFYTDVYAFSGTQGQQIAITMSSPDVDAFLELHRANDQADDPLDVDDDGGGGVDGTDARIPSSSGFFTLPATGTYYIWASSSFSEETGAYTITITQPGANPWASRCIQPITVGQTVSGELTSSDCTVSYGDPTVFYYTDVYTFQGQAGQQIAIAMDSPDADAWIELHNLNDLEAEPLFTGDDEVGTNARIPDSVGYFTLPQTGTYYIWANTARDGQTGTYTLRVTEAKPLTVTEFYHPGFDHYFITAYPEEAASLAAGNLPPWVPTGQTFQVWGSNGTFIDNVWRFFSASFAPLSGHFYTNNPDEAAALQAGKVWALEASDAFYMAASPDGTCPSRTRPLYRLYNDGMGGAPNHRYTIDPAIRQQMIDAKWVPEGNGPDGVFTCVPDPAAAVLRNNLKSRKAALRH